MRILVLVHGYMPVLAAGSERMIQHLLRPLVDRGHDVELWALDQRDDEDYFYDGVHVLGGIKHPSEARNPDVILAHHAVGADFAQSIAPHYPGCKTAVIYHNDRLSIPVIMALDADLSVFNTAWVAASLKARYRVRDSTVVRPPLVPGWHKTTPGDRVTLINLSDNKGVDIFYRLARRMPDTDFLGVIGTHGRQIVAPSRNVRIQDTVQDMRKVWSQTRILLVPSGYESYGMVAAEACASGIPVVAHPTPGLLECLGDSGIFLDRGDTDAWERELRRLAAPDAYQEASTRSACRAVELTSQTKTELRSWVRAIETLGAAS